MMPMTKEKKCAKLRKKIMKKPPMKKTAFMTMTNAQILRLATVQMMHMPQDRPLHTVIIMLTSHIRMLKRE